MKRITASIAAMLFSAMTVLPASASDFGTSGWVNGFTVNTTLVAAQDGGFTVTTTWTHSGAELTDAAGSPTPSSGVLDLANRGPMFCNSAVVVSPAQTNSAVVSGCMSSGFPTTPAPVDVVTTTGAQNTITSTWTIPAANVANFNPSYGFFGLRYSWVDMNGANYWIYSPLVSIGQSISTATGASPAPSAPAKAVYEGPEILAVDNIRPIVSGGKLTFTGKRLSSVASATIGSVAATLSYDVSTGLTIATPPVLAPGKYDLVMQSSYGKLTHINAVTIKAPTPTATIGFRSDAQHLNEKQVLDLVAFNETLSSDYEKVRCIVNASDPKTAKRIADLVCAQVARGEARNVEVIKELRNTYSGSGFWVRVYAAG